MPFAHVIVLLLSFPFSTTSWHSADNYFHQLLLKCSSSLVLFFPSKFPINYMKLFTMGGRVLHQHHRLHSRSIHYVSYNSQGLVFINNLHCSPCEPGRQTGEPRSVVNCFKRGLSHRFIMSPPCLHVWCMRPGS
jgi:hypothetical protein